MNGLPETAPDLTRLAEDFREALRHSVYLVRRLDEDESLSSSQVSTLKMLGSDGLRVSGIARNLGVRVPSATEHVIRLERSGLVRRTADPNDARAVIVTATENGTARLAEADQRRTAQMATLLGSLSAEDQAALGTAIHVLEKLNRAQRE